MSSENTSAKTFYFYKPEGVTGFLGAGLICWVGAIDESTVLKYRVDTDDEDALASLRLEAQIHKAIGPHRAIIGSKGQRSDGSIELERAHFGTVNKYLESHEPSMQQRSEWCRQTTEAVIAIHKAGAIHCDISVNNLLLDKDLNIKLCDFQGQLHCPDGSVKRGLACESTQWTMPRAGYNHTCKTDLFALASTFCYLLNGHKPFPDLDDHLQEQEIIQRFLSGHYPELACPHINRIAHKCWAGKYDSAEMVLRDLESSDGGDLDLMVGKLPEAKGEHVQDIAKIAAIPT